MSTYNPGMYATNPYPAPMGPSRRILRHIGVGSAFKVAAVLSALIWAVFGLLFLIFGLCGVFSSLGAFSQNNNGSGGGSFAALGGFAFVLIYVIGIVLYAIIGGITGALYAALYNVTSRWTGGLELDVS